MIRELAGAATRLTMLFAGCAGLAGLLLYSAELVPQKAAKPAPDGAKIGPSSMSRPAVAAPAPAPQAATAAAPAAAVRPAAAPAPFVAAPAASPVPAAALPAVTPASPATPPPALAASVPTYAPVRDQGAPRAEPQPEPATGPSRSLARRAPAPVPDITPPDDGTTTTGSSNSLRPAAAEPSRKPRHAPGAHGCTSYKTYNAETQTYRAFDGKVKPCRG